MDVSFKLEKHTFNYRVVFIVTNQACDKFLLFSYEEGKTWVPFGGRCKLGEFASDAVTREIKEELGDISFSYNKLVGSAENMFMCEGKVFHELSFIHHIIITDEKLLNQQGIASTFEDNDYVQKWFALNEIESQKVMPLYLPQLAKNIQKNKEDTPYQHYIANEL